MKQRGTPQPNHQKHNDGSPQECTVRGLLALVLRVSRCAGVAPLGLRAAAGESWRATASPPLATLQRCAIIILNGLVIAGLILDLREEPAQRIHVGGTTLNAFVTISEMAIVMAIANLAAWPGQARMEHLIRVTNRLQQINSDLKNDFTKNCESTGILMFAGLLVLTATVEIFENYLKIKIFKNWPIILMTVPYHIAVVQGLLVLMQWASSVFLVYDASAALNRHLLRLLHVNLVSEAEESAMREGLVNPSKYVVDCFTMRLHVPTDSEKQLRVLPSQVQVIIRHLAASFEQIGEVIQQMNAGYGAVLIFMLLCKFLNLMATPYYFLLRIYGGHDLPGVLFLLVSWTTVDVSTLLLAVEACHWTQGERETTKLLLSKLMMYHGLRCKRLCQEADQFVQQTLLTNAKFMPLGLYTLDRPLMATIFAGVTTYLILIVQFQTFN